MKPSAAEFAVNRRAFLARYAGSLGALALAHLLEDDGVRGAPLPSRRFSSESAFILRISKEGVIRHFGYRRPKW